MTTEAELRAMIKKQNEEIESLHSELHEAKQDIQERIDEVVIAEGEVLDLKAEIKEAKAELETAKKALSKIYRWTQQRDIGNPRSIIAGLAGDQLTKEERVKICNQEKLIDAQNTVDLMESCLYSNGESAESMKGTLGEAALKKAKADLETAKAKR